MGRRIRKKSNRKASTTAASGLRVAAYCRVSKNTNEQEDSLELQVSYYTNLIYSHFDWINAGVFADKGSGRNTKNRPAFLELMKLCRKKKVDLILVKSISRFGRNTLDALIAMRELEGLGIDIVFELEKLRLQDEGVRIMIEIMSALAQAESESRSKDIKWGIQRSYENPDCKLSHFTCFGYDHDDHGQLVINKPEAKIVKLIFKLRVEGNSLRKISAELERRRILSPTGNAKWSANTLAAKPL